MTWKRAAAVLFFAAAALGATAAWAGPVKLALSASSGIFFPKGEAYRALYGKGIPASFDGWLTLGRHFGVSAGLSFLSDSGTAVPMDGGEDEYPLKFRRLTIPASVYCELHPGRTIDVRLGAGLGVHHYEEKWTSLGLEAAGWKVSPRLYVSAGWRAVPSLERLAFIGTVAFDTIGVASGAPLADKPNIGGFQVLVGASYRVF